MNLEALINKHFEKLNPNDLDALAYIIKHKEQVATMGIEELASICHVSKSSLVRLTQKLAFSGFSEFKYALRQEVTQVPTETSPSNLSLLHQDIEETLKLIEQTNFTPILKKINQAKRVFAYGTDWSEKNAVNELTRNFMSSDIFIIQIPSVTEFNWMIDSLTEDDLVIIISYSGNNKHLQKNIALLKLKNVEIISITPLIKNELSQKATYSLYYHVTPLEFDGDKHKEYNFFITLNVIVDALFRSYMDYYLKPKN